MSIEIMQECRNEVLEMLGYDEARWSLDGYHQQVVATYAVALYQARMKMERTAARQR